MHVALPRVISQNNFEIFTQIYLFRIGCNSHELNQNDEICKVNFMKLGNFF